MKTKNLFILTALAAVLVLLSACDKDPKGSKEDPSIQVTPESIQAGWEGAVQEIEVTSNCNWTISKTDAEGSAVDWVKCDRSTGQGNLKFNVKVEKNPLGETRSATVTLFCDEVKAFIDVQQEANPDPNPGPGPGPQNLELEFDFTQVLEGWPIANETSWADLKNCDSGCATDNGGTATENSHRRAQVTYTLNGKGYDFTLADPNGAEKHNIRLDADRKGVYSGTLRYFGLPAIEGKKLIKVEMVQNASTKTQETFFRNVGVTPWVYHKDIAISEIQYVQGGEVQNQNTNGETYTYELSGTYPNTVYWLNSPTNASIIKSLKLTYTDPDGTEVAPGPEPADPAPGPGPDDPPGPGPDPTEPTLKLTFDFTGTPFEGWPTAAKYTHVEGGIECVYPLNGTNYIFVPADCGTASAGQAFWQPPVEASEGVEAKPGYFAFNAQYRYLGLPKLEGQVLTRVICHNVFLTSTTPKMGITTLINGSAAHPSNDAYVAGGALQSWDANGGETYTYNLSGTAANTRYYIYAYAKGAVDWIELGYNPAN